MLSEYALFENNGIADPDDYAASVQISGSADGDDLVQDIIDQGSTVTKPDILAVTAALKLACQRRVEQGQCGNYFGMMDFLPRIKGVFTRPPDSFDGSGTNARGTKVGRCVAERVPPMEGAHD